MKKEKRKAWLDLLRCLGDEDPNFYPMLCNVCRYFECRWSDDYNCGHPVEQIAAWAWENAEAGCADCFAFKPRKECRTLEQAEAYIRAGRANWSDEEDWQQEEDVPAIRGSEFIEWDTSHKAATE